MRLLPNFLPFLEIPLARTALTVTALKSNGSVANGSGTTGTVDGHYIDTNTRTKINDDAKPELVFLDVTVATAETDVTVKAGDYPPALHSGYGDLVVACPIGTTKIGPLTSGRYLRNNGQVWIDYETPANVTIRAFRLPRDA